MNKRIYAFDMVALTAKFHIYHMFSMTFVIGNLYLNKVECCSFSDMHTSVHEQRLALSGLIGFGRQFASMGFGV